MRRGGVWGWCWQGTYVLCVCACVGAFNIDLWGSHVTHISEQDGSMFGFAVAQHMDRGKARLLVGAPRYDTDQRARGVRRAGAVLSCDPLVPNLCTYVPFDKSGNNVHPLGQQLDNKSDQWFGATIYSSGPDGIVVACAPRYVWYTENLRRREPVGTCYLARNGLTDFQEYSPCRTRHWGFHRQGSCQAGFDAAISEDGFRMYIGAPGAFYWQGQIHSYNLGNRSDYQRTWEGPPTDDDQYLGYSLAVGDFNNDGQDDVALGVPKGLNYTGKVALFTHHLTPIQNITGYQLGSYFGYCLAVLDFNNDGLDDIVVGAPLYTDYEDREMKFEVGRVHVVLQNRLHRFRQVVTFTGEVNQARFGLSLTSLGDINKDGVDDLAVGAPYGGPDGSGAVFIYNGFEIHTGELIAEHLTQPSQVIYAIDVGLGIPMASFGWALSGGIDVDGNQYPDLLVGATHANAAVVLRSRPIVSLLNHSLTFLLDSEDVDIEATSLANREKDCKTRSGRLVSCIDLRFCVSYGGLAVPEEIEMEVKYQLDGKVKDPRLFFHSTDKQGFSEQLTLGRGRVRCRTHKTYVSPSLTDKLTPLGAEVRLALVEDPISRPRVPRSTIPPILNYKQQLNLSSSVNIKNNCGPDDICIPDLELTFEAPDTFVFGKGEQLEVAMRVMNHGEDAYQAKVYLPQPPGLQYTIVQSRDNTSAVSCSPRHQGTKTTLICDIGNPLKMHTGVYFAVFFQQQLSSLADRRLVFEVAANTTNPEAEGTLEDNFVRKTVMVSLDVDLDLYGSSAPENIAYNRSLYRTHSFRHEEHVGPEITHTFALSSDGSSEITKTEFVILWPTKTLSGNYLLYLLEQPHVTGPASCSLVPDVNPLNLELNKETSMTKLLKLQGEKTGGGGGEVTVEGEGQVGGSVVVEEERRYSQEGGAAGGVVVEGETEGERKEEAGGGRKKTYYEESSFTTYTTGEGGRGNYSSSSSTYSSSSSSSRTFSSSSSSSSSSSGSSEQLSRRARKADYSEEWDKETSSCGLTKCTKIYCTAGPLKDRDIAYVYVRSRLFLTTLGEYPYQDVTISSRMVARVTALPHGIDPDEIPIRTKDVTTPVSPAKSLDTAPSIPWWVIILAILAGVLILLLIILLLWKCGYFKRHRPDPNKATDDAEPLNPMPAHNGHPHSPYARPMYPGDEAL